MEQTSSIGMKEKMSKSLGEGETNPVMRNDSAKVERYYKKINQRHE